jgi:hypothetical protein
LWNGSIIYGVDATGYLAVIQSYCNWNHSKISYRIQFMIRLVIWIDLNAQSVCTYQIWIFLILWCSTCSEESRDYKFVIFGLSEQKIWFKHANRELDSNLKIVSNLTHKIWIIIVLLDSRCSKDSNGILFAIFGCRDQKIWFFKVSAQIWFNFYFELLFDLEKATWRYGIRRYRFGWICTGSRWIKRELSGSDLKIPFH